VPSPASMRTVCSFGPSAEEPEDSPDAPGLFGPQQRQLVVVPVSEASFSNWTEAPDAALLEGWRLCVAPLPAHSPLANTELPPTPQALPCSDSITLAASQATLLPTPVCATGSSTEGGAALATSELEADPQGPGLPHPLPPQRCRREAGWQRHCFRCSLLSPLSHTGSEVAQSLVPQPTGAAVDSADTGGAFLGSPDPRGSPGQGSRSAQRGQGPERCGGLLPESASLDGCALASALGGSQVCLSATDSLGATDSVVDTGSNTGSDSSGSHASCGALEADPERAAEGPPAEGQGSWQPPSASPRNREPLRGSLPGVLKVQRCRSVSEAEETKKEASKGGGGFGTLLGGGLFGGAFLRRPPKQQAVRSRGKKGGTNKIPLHIPRQGVLACAAPQACISFDLGNLEEAVRGSMQGAELPWVDYREIVQQQGQGQGQQQRHEQGQELVATPSAVAKGVQQSTGLLFSLGRDLLHRDRGAKGPAREGRGKGLRALAACGPGAFGAIGRSHSFLADGDDDDEPGLALADLEAERREVSSAPRAAFPGEYQQDLGFASDLFWASHLGPLEAVLEEDTLPSEQP